MPDPSGGAGAPPAFSMFARVFLFLVLLVLPLLLLPTLPI